MKVYQHHNDSLECPGCEDRANDADVYLRGWFKWVKSNHAGAHISWSYRDEESQNEALADGKTKLAYPDSKHNASPSRALDLFQLVDGKALFDKSFYVKVKEESVAQNFDLRYGQDFPHLGDFDHFELKD